MSGRFQARATRTIDASIDRVWAIAADPRSAPRFAPEIRRIEDRGPADDGDRLMRCYMRAGPIRYSALFRYRRRPTRLWSGRQVGGAWLGGYFAFVFHPCGDRTRVTHVEGVRSRVPGLARGFGWLYYRALRRRKLDRELDRLAALCGAIEGDARSRGSLV